MLELYLRLQRGEPAPAPIPAQVTPPPAPLRVTSALSAQVTDRAQARPQPAAPHIQTATVSPAPVPRDVVRARISQLEQSHLHPPLRNINNAVEDDAPLPVLVSEGFLEQQCATLGELERRHGVRCIDCALEQPVSMIVDACTAICLVPSGTVLEKAQLKQFVKQLTRITFKYSCIYIVVVLDDQLGGNNATGGALLNASWSLRLSRAMLTLKQALVRFPAQAFLCECCSTTSSVTTMLARICQQCAAVAVQGGDTTSRAYRSRPYLQCLNDADAQHMAHCEFLQRYPTVNYYLAAWMLHVVPLQQLVATDPAALTSTLRRGHALPQTVEACVRAFLQLSSEHIGLVAVGL